MMGVGQNQLAFGPGDGATCAKPIVISGSDERRILDLGIEAWLSTAYPDHQAIQTRRERAGESTAVHEVHSIRATNGSEFDVCFEFSNADLD